RRAGEPEFDEREVDLLAAASPLLARAVRRGLVTEACDSPAPPPEAPGVVELDASGAPTRLSSSAESLLAELSGTSVAAGVRSPALQAVASATRAAIAGNGRSDRPALPSSAVKTPAGTWLVLHGALLGSGPSSDVAVFLQRAHPTLVAPL